MTLHPFQKEAVDWLKENKSGLLHAATGTGKTIMALEYARSLPIVDGRLNRVLFIVPNAVKLQWASEARRHFDIGMFIIGGTPKEREHQWKVTWPFAVVNYELLLKDYKYVLTQHFDCVIVDECHRMANHAAKTVRVIKKIRTDRKVALSATPISNGRHDLYSQLDWIKPGCLGKSWWSFRSYFCVMHHAFPKIIGYQNQERFESITKPLIYHIPKSVLVGLPALRESIIPFDLSTAERRFYDQIRKELIVELIRDDGEQELVPIGNALTKLLRLRQSCNTLAPFGHSGVLSSKLRTLTELLEDLLLDPDNKILIFSSFKETVKEYHQELSKHWKGRTITGDDAMADRQVSLAEFEKDPGIRYLLCTSAADTGLNIQAANIVIHIDDPLSFAKLEQRNGRAHRLGQTRPVLVYHLRAQRTVDEYIAGILEHKKDEASFNWRDIKTLLQ